jgi:hypothetical protein
MPEDNKMKLLGQEIPLNLWFFLIVVSVCILAFALEKYGHGVHSLATGIRAGYLGDDSSEKTDSLIFIFWTPGAETWSHTKDQDELDAAGISGWYKTTDQELDNFGKSLIGRLGAQGYSRNESVGEGSSRSPKIGWTWSVTFAKPKTEAEISNLKNEFKSLYTEKFKRDKKIYLEIRDATALKK